MQPHTPPYARRREIVGNYPLSLIISQEVLDKCQCCSMLLYTASMATLLATREVVLKVIELDIDSRLVARLADTLNILHIGSLLVVGE